MQIKGMETEARYIPLSNKDCEVFHVHTKRCKHAYSEDRELIDAAIELGASRIVFVDHAPFPGDPFGHRMYMSQYDEYLSTMESLKDEYSDSIEVLKGFEIEYLPSFRSYYADVRSDERVDVMVLGQHMYELPDGSYSFSLQDRSSEYNGIVDSIYEGKETGLFDVVAHPERAFKRCKGNESDLFKAKDKLIECLKTGIYVEHNYISCYEDTQIFFDFWKGLEGFNNIVYGYDAHSAEEMRATNHRNKKYEEMCKETKEFLDAPYIECPVPIYKVAEYIEKHDLPGVDLTDEELVKQINEEIPDR